MYTGLFNSWGPTSHLMSARATANTGQIIQQGHIGSVHRSLTAHRPADCAIALLLHAGQHSSGSTGEAGAGAHQRHGGRRGAAQDCAEPHQAHRRLRGAQRMLQVRRAPSLSALLHALNKTDLGFYKRRLNHIRLMAQPTEQHRPVKRSSLVSMCTVRAFSGLHRDCSRAECRCRTVESRMRHRNACVRLGGADAEADWTWSTLDEASAFSLAFKCGTLKSRESLEGAWDCLTFRS